MGRILLRLLMSLFPSPLEQEVGKTMRDILGHCRHRDRRAYDTAVLTLREPVGEYLQRPGLRRRERGR